MIAPLVSDELWQEVAPLLPQEMGCGSGMTCWRRLRDWQDASVWTRLHRLLLDRLGKGNAIDWSRACVDNASLAAKEGVKRPDRTLSTVAGPDQKRHVLVDGNRIPLALLLTAANRHDSKLLEPLTEAVVPIRQCIGRPRRRPAKLHADKSLPRT